MHFPACSRAYGLRALWQLAEMLPHRHYDLAGNTCNSGYSDWSTGFRRSRLSSGLRDSPMPRRDGRKAERPARRDKASPDRCENTLCREEFPEWVRSANPQILG